MDVSSRKATEEGATVAWGGSTPEGPLAGGCFVEPTVITDVEPSMSIRTAAATLRDAEVGLLVVGPADAVQGVHNKLLSCS